jgi:hypothetical protein
MNNDKQELQLTTGSTFKYRLSIDKVVQHKINTEKFENTVRTKLAFILNVYSLSNSNYLIGGYLDNYKTEIYFKENDTLYTSKISEKEIDFQKKLESAINGTNFTFNLSKSGVITNLTGFDIVRDKVNNIYKNDSTLFPNEYLDIFSTSYFSGMISHLFINIPSDPSIPWTSEDSLETMFGHLKFRSMNKMTSLDDEYKTVSSNGVISSHSILKVPIFMNGTLEGYSKINRKSGLLESSKKIITLKGNLKTNKIEIPYLITSTTEVHTQ